jgi:hypothetical protein
MPVNELQVPDGLMNFLIVMAVIFVVQTAISLGYLILEIVRDGRDHPDIPADEDEIIR